MIMENQKGVCMDISKIGLTLLLTGKVIIKDENNIWEFYLKDGKSILLYENNKLRGQKQLSGPVILPAHVRVGVEYLIDVFEIERLQVLLKIPRERMYHWKHNV